MDQRIKTPNDQEIVRILMEMGKQSVKDELNCGACGYETCREHAIAIHKGLAEDKMCLRYTIDRLRKTVNELAVSHEQLLNTQKVLAHTEKLANMGQIAAGIAHEINNPLGAVSGFPRSRRLRCSITAMCRFPASRMWEVHFLLN